MKTLSSKQKIIFSFFLLMIIVLVFITSWASHKKNKEYGPALIAEDAQGHIWAEVNNDIFILDGQGKLLQRMSAKQLGIELPFASFAPMPDGRMLIGSHTSGKIHFIKPDGTRDKVIDPAETSTGRFFGVFHLFYDSANDEILVSDTSNHRIIVLSTRGELLRQAGEPDKKPGWLNFPNGILKDRQGSILVANTNQHKIYVLSESLEIEETLNPIIRDIRGFVWPVFIGMDKEERIYITNHDNGLKFGELVRLNKNGKREITYNLTEDTEPMSILVRGKDILLTDQTSFNVYKIGQDDETVSVFGDETFKGILADSKERWEGYRRIKEWSWLFLIVILVLLLILLILAHKKESRNPTEMQFDRRTIGVKPSGILHLEYLLVITLIVLPLPVALLIFLSLLLGLMTYPFYMWLTAVVGGGFFISILFAITLLGSFIFAKNSRSGRYHQLLQGFDKKLLNKFSRIIVKLLQKDEKVTTYAMGIVNGFHSLTVMTGKRIIIASLNQLTSRIMRIQVATSPSNVKIALSGPYSGKWRWLLGFGFPTTCLSFSVGDGARKYSIDFLNHKTAEEIQKEILAYEAVESMEGSTLRDFCVTCQRDLSSEKQCPNCGAVSSSVWKPVVLSVLFPGFGQLFNQDLFKGILYMITYSYMMIGLIDPFFAFLNRTASVDIRILLFALILAILIWLFSIYDALITSRRNKFQRWGLVDS